jgi:predicted transcriptional regulator
LEDGRQYKSLKRHLTGRGLTPAEYRTKWGLPHDYPMVAANYAAQRSELAKAIGLGRKRAEPEVQAPRRRKAA